jgi:hypothetical protein
MPRPRKNPGEPLDCSRRSVNPFQTYVNHLITKKPEKISLLLARALMNDDALMDFNGKIHANECVFSYPNSNWYSVYLLDDNGKMFWGNKGAQKFYFQMEFKINEQGVPVDAFPLNGTFEVPDELKINGVEMKNCVIKNGKCANPEPSVKKKKKTIKEEDYEEEQEETSQQILESLKGTPATATGAKQKMPRDYFEKLGSKALIIDWMIANMKPDEIFKCIQSGSLSSDDVKQAKSILESGPAATSSAEAGPSGITEQEIKELMGTHTPAQIQNIVRTLTKQDLVKAISRIKDPSRKRNQIISVCRRAGITKYSLKVSPKGKATIVDDEGEVVDDISEIIDECATKEAFRIRRLLKLKSISQDIKQGGLSKQDLMDYRGGNVRIPYSLMASVKRHFPLIRKYENRNGDLFASIPSEIDEDGQVSYFVVDDLLGKDLKKLDKKMQAAGGNSFGKKRKGKVTVTRLKIDLNYVKR